MEYKIEKKEFENLYASEKNFIKKSWLTSYRGSSECFRMANSYYFKVFGKIIDELMERSLFLVAFEMKNIIIGFSCFEEEMLHYIYIRDNMRGKGVAKSLLPDKMKTITFVSKDFDNFTKDNFTKVRYNYCPFERY